MVVAPVWAFMGTLGNMGEEVLDASRIEAFNYKASKDFVKAELKEGRLKSDLYKPAPPSVLGPEVSKPPVYDESHFKISCPNAAGDLPIRQDCLSQVGAS